MGQHIEISKKVQLHSKLEWHKERKVFMQPKKSEEENRFYFKRLLESRSKSNHTGSAGISANAPLWGIVRVALFIIVLILILEVVYRNIIVLVSPLHMGVSSGILSLMTHAVKLHPFAFIVMLLVSGTASAILTGAIKQKVCGRNLLDERGFEISESKEAGSAEFLSDEDKHIVFNYEDIHRPKGNVIAIDKKTGKALCIPYRKSVLPNGNKFVAGSPGTGKTTCVLLPDILDGMENGNFIAVTDSKGEIYESTYAAAKYLGYNIKVFNILGTQFEHSDGWDCLKIVRESKSPETDAHIFANILLNNTAGSTGEGFWRDANENCLKLAILYVAKAKAFEPNEVRKLRENDVVTERPDDDYQSQRTLKEVLALITSGEMKDVISKAIDADPGDGALLNDMYNNWAKHKEADSIAAGLGTRLSVFQVPEVARILSTDEIDIQNIADTKTIIYIITADNDDSYKAILTLFSTFLFKTLTTTADRTPKRSFERVHQIIFEEAGNIGQIPNMAKYVSTVRSRNIIMTFCFQALGQMMDIYSSKDGRYEWEYILTGCSMQLCVGSNDATTSKYFSDRTGPTTIIDKRVTEDRNKLLSEGLQDALVLDQRQATGTKGRPLLLPDEVSKIGRGDRREILISLAGFNVTVEKKYFWKNHPLSHVKMFDRGTKKEVLRKTYDHIPDWAGGEAEQNYVFAIDEDSIDVNDAAVETYSGKNSYTDFL